MGVNRVIQIAIDPGHGGNDPGAMDAKKRKEKDITLAISQKAQRMINRHKGFHASLTRSKDIYLDLLERIEIAQNKKADLLISIHADSFKQKKVRGAVVYTLSKRGASTNMSRWLVERENAAGTGPKYRERYQKRNDWLESIVFDLKQSQTIAMSLRFAKQLKQTLQKNRVRLYKKEIDRGAFVILTSPSTPSVLIETGFLSNTQDAYLLQKSWYQNRIARAISNAVTQSFPTPKKKVNKKKLKLFWVKHRIRPGDTLSKIAQRYRTPLKIIINHNHIKDPKKIQIGHILSIPIRQPK
jgi:N-acetylmuramoyl-L-alanine amidase